MQAPSLLSPCAAAADIEPATAAPANLGTPSREALDRAFRAVRSLSRRLTEHLSPEDQQLQSMPDASPVKWHLGHTTWFFETLVLRELAAGYRPFDTRFATLFNSYYESLGPRHPRPQRGVLSRPGLDEVWRYRAHIDRAIGAFIADAAESAFAAAAPTITLGLHHEQQHQELILTDLKHAFSLNPLAPAYAEPRPRPGGGATPPAMEWLDCAGGIVGVGHAGDGFAFDNEQPRHRVLLEPFQIGSRTVTCGEYRAFIDDGGYRRPELWLSDGWAQVQAEGWRAPGYWQAQEDGDAVFTLCGLRPIDPAEPVCHLSFYEAWAYAQWARARLPTEFEWEAACALHGGDLAHRYDPSQPHPVAALGDGPPMRQALGEVWEWTCSSYAPYPGFRPLSGTASEYNGKFMVNQIVLRGGSCATPPGHLRRSYRNFFPPGARWQFSGLRLARDAGGAR